MNSLRTILATIQPGQVDDTTDLERVLAASWDEFTGDDGGMAGHKLLARMEDVTWNPPVLRFVIERHGGTVLGSTRAELQHWEVNVEKKTAVIVKHGHRQLEPMADRIYPKPLVERILAAIRSGSENELVSFRDDGSISLNTTTIFPSGSAFNMTLAGRRKRLREAVAAVLLKEGWERLGNDEFRPLPRFVDRHETVEQHVKQTEEAKPPALLSKNVQESQRVGKLVRAKQQQCYINACRVIWEVQGYSTSNYVEGIAVQVVDGGGVMFEHGWVEKDGEIIDPTLPTEVYVYYAGLRCVGQRGLAEAMAIPKSEYTEEDVPIFYRFGWAGSGSPEFSQARKQAERLAFGETYHQDLPDGSRPL